MIERVRTKNTVLFLLSFKTLHKFIHEDTLQTKVKLHTQIQTHKSSHQRQTAQGPKFIEMTIFPQLHVCMCVSERQ